MHGFHSHIHNKDELKKDIAIYYGMISLMDKYIGKILDKLNELNLANDTIVVFTTDHGHLYGQHGLIAKGAFHYEDLLRLPFMVRYPGNIPAGKISDSMQSLVDLAPTFLDMIGAKIPRSMTANKGTGTMFAQQTWYLSPCLLLCSKMNVPQGTFRPSQRSPKPPPQWFLLIIFQ